MTPPLPRPALHRPTLTWPTVPKAVSDAVTIGGYRLGWSLVRRLPEHAAYALFERIADATVARGGAARLRSNLAVVRPDLDDEALDAVVKEGMRSYMRYYCTAFRLPDIGPEGLDARVRCVGDAPVRAVTDAGGSVVCFLGHMGNWDLAGAWATVYFAPVTTVAERLRPEEVFEEFLAFREGLGMRILPLTGGEGPFPQLREAARERMVIPLLADRDLTRHGVEVTLCGAPAKMAAGPATLALLEDRPLVPVSIHHERVGKGWGIRVEFHEQVPVPAHGTTREKVAAMTQSCADALGAAIQAHPTDWHMLQRVFVEPQDAGAR